MKKTFKTFMTCLSACCTMALLSSAAPAAAPGIMERPTQTTLPTSVEKYENTEKNYTISYPSNWIKKDVPSLDLVLFARASSTSAADVDSQQIHASMNVISEKTDGPLTLQQFFDESIANLKTELKDVQMGDQGEVTLNGTPAKWILYSHEMENIKFKVLQYFILANERVYLLTFSSTTDDFKNFRPDFEQIASSFKLLNNTLPNTKAAILQK